MSMKEYVLRKATLEDTDFLFELRNDPTVREQSFQTDKIQYEDHKKWLDQKLKTNYVRIFILEYQNEKIGQVRVDIDEKKKSGNISYAVKREWRRKGLGTWMLKSAEKMLDDIVLMELIGEVKRENIASQKVFRRLGYDEKKTDYGYIYKKILLK